MKRKKLQIAARLIVLVQPMLPIMLLAVTMGVAGYLCAAFLTIFGGFGLLSAAGRHTPLGTVEAALRWILLFAALRGALRYAEQASNHYIAFKLLALLRDKVFRALRRLAPARLAQRDKGDLIALITADIEQLEVFYAHTISPIAIALIVCGIMTAFTASYHPLAALVLLAGYVAVGVAIPVWAAQRGNAAGQAYREALAGTNSYVLESLRGLRESIQYRGVAARSAGIAACSAQLSEKQKAMKHREGLTAAMTNTAILLTALAVLATCTALYGANRLTAEGVLICTLAALSSFGPVVALANLAANLVQVFASAGRVLDLLDEEPAAAEIVNGADVTFSDAACEDVTFSYGARPVLEHVSLSIPRNSIIGVAGKSGSGKSTLLRLLMRFWDVEQGAVRLSGRDVRDVNTASLRAAQSLVTQETELFDDTIENNIRIARLNATHAEIVQACKKAALHTFITQLPQGYNTRVGELGSALSGGERQRIGIARAFLHDAPFLLLDEPTSNLDSLNEGIILRALQQQRQGKTVLLVSHRKSTIAAADALYEINCGRMC